jgi:hypothetical protein
MIWIWFAAGLELGTWRPLGSQQDILHGVVAQLDVAVADHVTPELFFRFQGLAHGIDECIYVSKGSVVDVAAGSRFDLFSRTTPHTVRPHASLAFGASRVDVRPDCGTEYAYSAFVFLLSAGADIYFWPHFGLRPEARLSVAADGPCCAGPTGNQLSGALLLFLAF